MNRQIITEVGPWSELKLKILKSYSKAYSTAFKGQRRIKRVYIDGFAGAGIHISKSTKQEVQGSPLNALDIVPPFDHHYFIDIDKEKIEVLRSQVGSRQDVTIQAGDCNQLLLDDVFPKVKFEDYRRGLCFLDPYGLHLRWQILETAGKMRTVEIFLNFPILDIDRNVARKNLETVDQKAVKRMDQYWGNDEWHELLYQPELDLFGGTRDQKIAKANSTLPSAFRKRLRKIAGFKFVPEPIAMRRPDGRIMYYIFFASNNSTGHKIAKHLFDKYRKTGEV